MKAFGRNAWTAFALGLALGAAALVLAGAAGGRANPMLDVLTHLAPLYAVAGLAALAMSLGAPRPVRWLSAGLFAVTASACATMMVPEYRRSLGPQAPASAPNPIKIIQFNGFRGNHRIADVVDWLIAEQPDIVTIQETRPDLRAAILARTAWSVAGLPSGTLTVFSAKPYQVMNRPKTIGPLHYVNATYASSSGPFELITVHFDWPTSRNHVGQREQLIEMIASRPHDRLILTGDFNSTPWSYDLRDIDRRSGLIRRERAMFSYPAGGDAWDPISLPAPVLPIDHVYAGPGWATLSVTRGPRLGSDHYPVVMMLAPVGR